MLGAEISDMQGEGLPAWGPALFWPVMAYASRVAQDVHLIFWILDVWHENSLLSAPMSEES